MFDPSLLLCSWISSSIGSSKLYSPDFGSFSSLRFDFDCFVSYYSSSDSVFQSSFSGSSSTTFMLSLSNFLMGK